RSSNTAGPAGTTSQVSLAAQRQISKLYYETSDDNKYIVNRTSIGFYLDNSPSGSGGSPVFVIGVTANYLFTPAAPTEVAVDHMEIVQVVQTRDNSVPLIPGKSTVVRAFLQSRGDNAKPVTGI